YQARMSAEKWVKRETQLRSQQPVLIAGPLSFSSTEHVDLKVGPAQHSVACRLRQPQHARQIDAHQVTPPLLDLAGNEDSLDMAGVHEVRNDAGCVVERPNIEPIGLKYDDVGLLARCQCADLAVEVGAAGALD